MDTGQNPAVEKLIDQAISALQSERLTEAFVSIDSALSVGVTTRDLHHVHALCLIKARRLREAVDALRKEIDLYPDNAPVKQLLHDLVLEVCQEEPAAQSPNVSAAVKSQALPIGDWRAVISSALESNPNLAVNQIVHTISYGDAIGSCMLHVRNLARSWGLQSHIFAERGDPRISKTDWLAFDEHHNYSSPQSLLLYHPHNSNSAVAHYFRSVPDRKILYYHNITPAKFFAPWSPQLAADCEAARNEAVALSGAAQATISDSEYNSSELAAAGFERRSVLPLPFFKEQFESSEPDAELGARLRDGATNLLFVGRIAPNKCQHELVEFFDYYRKRVNANARLVIVGTQDTASGYFQKIVENIQTNRIDNAILVGHVTFPQLVSIYRTASAFVCFSEHEGFCVPLLESMYFDVPIIAYDSSAVGETMGTAGIKLRSKDFSAVSAAVERLRNDAPFRSAVIQGQRERLEFFSENNFEERLGRIVAANLTMQ